MASTDGFCLGMAFDRDGDLFVCDQKHAAVFRQTSTGKLELFADGVSGHRFRIPNYPAFDSAGRLFVSDSWEFGTPGPGVVVIDPDGTGRMWHAGPLHLRDGLAFSADGTRLYVVETFRSAVSVIDVEEDGSAGAKRDLVTCRVPTPTGSPSPTTARSSSSCYQPSRIVRVRPGGEVEVVGEDVSAHLLAHPTNVAFQGDALLAANLGRWHITRLEIGVAASLCRRPPVGPRRVTRSRLMMIVRYVTPSGRPTVGVESEGRVHPLPGTPPSAGCCGPRRPTSGRPANSPCRTPGSTRRRSACCRRSTRARRSGPRA